MTIRIAMIGAGAVASIHAANLSNMPEIEMAAVYSPDHPNASAFAATYGIKSVSESVAEAIEHATVAIICSPSGHHFEQARECLTAGVHTLIELPPCADASQAEELGESARRHGLQIGCAHTARFLLPYERIAAAVRAGSIGEIREVNYIRHLRPRARSWQDNALLHHAAHSIDLVMNWCGGLVAIGCAASPTSSAAQAAAILGRLPNGGYALIAVSYASHLPHTHMLIVGTKHTVETDGFSYINSDLPELRLKAIEEEVYEQAICKQDLCFLAAAQRKGTFIDWAESVRLVRTVNRFQSLSERAEQPPE